MFQKKAIMILNERSTSKDSKGIAFSGEFTLQLQTGWRDLILLIDGLTTLRLKDFQLLQHAKYVNTSMLRNMHNARLL